jgi:hypothetical protein
MSALLFLLTPNTDLCRVRRDFEREMPIGRLRTKHRVLRGPLAVVREWIRAVDEFLDSKESPYGFGLQLLDGMYALHHRWLRTFPALRNPQFLGTMLIVGLLIAASIAKALQLGVAAASGTFVETGVVLIFLLLNVFLFSFELETPVRLATNLAVLSC